MVRMFLRALGALVTLLALLVGLPAVLAYGTWAVVLKSGPGPTSISEVLQSPDHGSLLLWALVVVGWIAWLCFAVSVLVEIPAQLRGRVPRHLPALGWSQRLAGGLVGAILALLPMAGGALAASGAPAPRLAVSAPLTPDFVAAAPDTAAPRVAPEQASPHAHHPHYVVRESRPAETLWSIAERTLGSGERWREIASLNEGRVMDAHHRVFDAERPLHPGWDLVLPRDAQLTAGSAGPDGPHGPTGQEAQGRQRGPGRSDGAQLPAADGSAGWSDDTGLSGAPAAHGAPGWTDDARSGPAAFPASGRVHGAGAAHRAVPLSSRAVPLGEAAHGAGRAGLAPTGDSAGGHGPGSVQRGTAGAGRQRVVTVRPGDTLSAIAQRELGSADAWPELFDANRGVVAPDGSRLTDPNLIEPGMRLTIPSGDSDTGTGTTVPAPQPSPVSAVSSPPAGAPAGNGSPASKPTGLPSTLPSPSAHASAPATPSQAPAGVAPGAGAHGSADTAHHGGHQSPTQFAVAAGTSVLGAVLLGAVALRRSRRRTVTPRQASRAAQHRASGWPRRTEPDGLGYPPLEPAAAAVPPLPTPPVITPPVAPPTPALRPARPVGSEPSAPYAQSAPAPYAPSPFVQPPGSLQQPTPHMQTPQAAFAQPAPAPAPSPAGSAEQQSERDLDLLGRALRSMARNVAREGRRLPPINVVRVTAAHTVELHLIAPSPPVAPFRAAHASTVWWCTPDAPGLLGPEAAAVVPSPYPALVSLGETVDGATVLVDLEAIRLLHLSGEPHDIAQVLRTLALELTFTPLADRVGVHVVGIAQELAAVADDRLVVHPDLEHAVAALQRRDASVRSALVQAGAATPREARSRGLGGDEWAPEVILCASYPTGELPEALGRLLDARPRGSVAVITAAPPQGTGPVARWTLPAAGHGVVPGLEMDIELQKLDDATYDHWLRLLGADLAQPTAPGASPAPSWPSTGPLDAALASFDGTAPGLDGAYTPTSGYPPPQPAADPRFPEPSAYPTSTPGSDPRLPEPFSVSAEQPAGSDRFPGPTTYPPAAPAAAPRFPQPGGLPGAGAGGVPRAGSPISSRFLEPGAPMPMTGAQFPPAVAPQARPVPPALTSGFPAAPSAPSAPGLPAGGHHSPATSWQAPVPPGQGAGAAPGSGDAGAQSRFPAPGAYPEPSTLPSILPSAGPRVPAQGAAPETWISALLATPPAVPAPGVPELRVLGPVELVGASGPVEPAWRAALVETAARRQLGPAQGANVPSDAIAHLRAWLGDGPDGLPVNLRCDWDDFQALRDRGLADQGNAGDSALARALALVRGAAFAETGYAWAEPLRTRMGVEVVDVAHELTLRRLHARDHRGAEAAAHRGLVAEPDAELLLRDLVLVHADAGDAAQLQRVVARLETKAMRTGVPLEPETSALLDELRSPVIDPLARR